MPDCTPTGTPAEPCKVDRNAGVGGVMRDLRVCAKKTQVEAGDAMGVERTSVCNMEGGSQAVTLEKLCRFADFIGHDVTVEFKPRGRRGRVIRVPLEPALLGSQS